MANASLPRNIDNHRTPGERPTWCHQNEAEDSGIDFDGAAVLSWSQEFGTTHLGADLVAEDHISIDSAEARDTRVYVYSPECGGMSIDEAELFALTIIEAVKAARGSEAQR